MANTKEKICIIGGGPAGLACAVYLEKKGYTDYTIYEKLNKVGGKAYSPKIKVVASGKGFLGLIIDDVFVNTIFDPALTYDVIHKNNAINANTFFFIVPNF